jgi:hypothetical protein
MKNGTEAARKVILGSVLNEYRFEDSLRDIDVFAGTCCIVITLLRVKDCILENSVLPTARWGSFPHEYILANSSPAMLLHHLVCCMESPFTATFWHTSSRPMSRRHSRAAIFVMCARGVSAVPGAEANMSPFNPFSNQLLPNYRVVGLTYHAVQENKPEMRLQGQLQ